MIESTPKFLQAVLAFKGAGYDSPVSLAGLSYVVPSDKRAQPVYLRAGNSSDAMVTLVLTRDGAVMRLFPIAAKGATHVPLVVVEDLEPDQAIALTIAAPEGVAGTVVVDFGVVEI
jgi:hypothetical protein